MPQSLDNLIRHLKPYWLGAIASAAPAIGEGPDIDIVGSTVGRGGDVVILFDSGGNPVAEWAATNAGLLAALAAATSGDTVEIPSLSIAIADRMIVPAGVTLRGIDKLRTKLTCASSAIHEMVVLMEDSRLTDMSLEYSYGDFTSGRTPTAVWCKNGGYIHNIKIDLTVSTSEVEANYAIGLRVTRMSDAEVMTVGIDNPVYIDNVEVNVIGTFTGNAEGILYGVYIYPNGYSTTVTNISIYVDGTTDANPITCVGLYNFSDPAAPVENYSYLRDVTVFAKGTNKGTDENGAYVDGMSLSAVAPFGGTGTLTIYDAYVYAEATADYCECTGIRTVRAATIYSSDIYALINATTTYSTCYGLYPISGFGLTIDHIACMSSGVSSNLGEAYGAYGGYLSYFYGCIFSGTTYDFYAGDTYLYGNQYATVYGDPNYLLGDRQVANWARTVTTGTTTLDSTYTFVKCDATGGNVTINLPATASNANRSYTIKRIDASANTVTVDGNAGETIDGNTTINLSQYDSLVIHCDGTEWWIL